MKTLKEQIIDMMAKDYGVDLNKHLFRCIEDNKINCDRCLFDNIPNISCFKEMKIFIEKELNK